jgi:hypothetical protein
MSRYIDADKYLDELDKQICSDCIDEDAHCCSCGVGSARAIAKDAPTADVVEVVRCKDCAHYHEIKGFDYKGRKARQCVWHSALRHEDDYCSDGIRREK